MKAFIDINRLDYINPADIYITDEFLQLKNLRKIYNCKAIEFFIRNNLHRHRAVKNQFSLLALRIIFKDIWEWHIPEELEKITVKIGSLIAAEKNNRCDCLWMLKKSIPQKFPVFFGDIILFLHDHPADSDLQSAISEILNNETHVAESQILASLEKPDHPLNELQTLYLPCRSTVLLHCEFAHDMIKQARFST